MLALVFPFDTASLRFLLSHPIPSSPLYPLKIYLFAFFRYEKYVTATDGGRGGPGDGGRDAFGEAHSQLLGKLAALQTRCDEAAAASDRAMRAGINADIR